MNYIKLSLFLLLSCLIASCSSLSSKKSKDLVKWNESLQQWEALQQKSTVAFPSEFPPKSNAIDVSLEVSPELNLYRGFSHPVVLKVLQLSDSNQFVELSKTKTGLLKVLDDSFTDPSVITSTNFSVMPGDKSDLIIDRREGTRQIAFVFGFYDMKGINSTKIISLPAPPVKKKGVFDFVRALPIFPQGDTSHLTKPMDLKVKLVLGKDKIEKTDGSGKI